MKKFYLLIYMLLLCTLGSYAQTPDSCRIVTLPYTENFDSYGTGSSVFPNCWTKLATGATIPIPRPHYEGGTAYVSSGGSLCIYSSNSTYCIASLPKIDSSIIVSTLQVTFRLYTGGLQIGIMTDPLIDSTFTLISIISPSYSWEEVEVLFNTYTGTGRYIAFRAFHASYFNYLDDVSIDYIPTCITPINIEINSIEQTNATVSWAPRGSESFWDIAYVLHGNDPSTGILTTVYDTTTTITGLTSNTDYDVYVRANCGNETSDWSNAESFQTRCNAISVLPYNENFDSYTDCWDQISSTGNNYPVLIASSDDTILKFQDAQVGGYFLAVMPQFASNYPINQLQIMFSVTCLYLNVGNFIIGIMTDPDNISSFVPIDTIRPSMANDWERFEVSFIDYFGTGQYIAFKRSLPENGLLNTYSITDISVDYISSHCIRPTNLTTTNVTANSVDLNWNERGFATSWNIEYGLVGFTQGTGTIIATTNNSYSITGLTNATAYQVYVQSDCGSGNFSNWIGPVSFTAQNICESPIDPTVYRIMGNTADISWNAGGSETSWNIEYGLVGFTQGTGALISTTNTSYTITGLTAVTAYQAYVQADCGGGDVSAWIGPVSFTTACSSDTIPVSENFDSYPNEYSPDCWRKLESSNITGFAYIYSTYSYSSPKSLKIGTESGSTSYYGFIRTNQLNITDFSNIQLSFKGKKSSGSTKPLVVGIMSDATDISTITILDTIENMTSTWSDYTILLSSYTDTGKYVVIGVPAGIDESCIYWVDDFVIDNIPSCIRPTNLSVTNITANSVDLNWTEMGTATAWNIEYGSTGFSQGTGTIISTTNNPYAITGLTVATAYQAYVRSDCNNGDFSTWIGPVSFTTHDTCEVPTNLTVSGITENSADVSWDAGGSETLWTLEYKTVSSGNYNSISCSNNSYTLTGLSSLSDYVVRVKAVCGTGNESDYISSNFTTDSAQVIAYTITASAGDNGVISPSGTISIPQGGNQTFTISPGNGYNIQDVLVDNISQGDTSSYTFYDVQENHAISVSFIAGIEDNVSETDVLIFPNPANNVLNIKSGEPFERVKITNLLGQVLYNAKIVNSDFSINISSYNSGIYFVRLEGSQGSVTKKFVKK